MSSKVKLVIAVVLFVIAIAAIGYYFANSGSKPTSEMDRVLNAPGEPPAAAPQN
jgi:flagellar basal body-associated protein FliL